MTGGSKGCWLALAVAVMLLWTFLPMYWTVKYAFMTKTEISRFPPPFYPHQPTFASFYNIFGFDYKAGDGTIFKASGQSSQIVLGLRHSLIVALVVTAITTCVVVPLSYIFAPLEFRFNAVLLTPILLSVSLPPSSPLL